MLNFSSSSSPLDAYYSGSKMLERQNPGRTSETCETCKSYPLLADKDATMDNEGTSVSLCDTLLTMLTWFTLC